MVTPWSANHTRFLWKIKSPNGTDYFFLKKDIGLAAAPAGGVAGGGVTGAADSVGGVATGGGAADDVSTGAAGAVGFTEDPPEDCDTFVPPLPPPIDLATTSSMARCFSNVVQTGSMVAEASFPDVLRRFVSLR